MGFRLAPKLVTLNDLKWRKLDLEIFLRFPSDKTCPQLLATNLVIFRTSAGDLCFLKSLNYFCLPSSICGQFIYWRLVDSYYRLESVLVLLFLKLFCFWLS